MPTLTAVVLRQQQHDDGTWNVKIRVHHNGKNRYIATNLFVGKEQLSRDYKLRPGATKDESSSLIREYRRLIVKHPRANSMTCEELVSAIRTKPLKDINFFAFIRLHIKRVQEEGRKGSAHNFNCALNSLTDFFGRKNVPITEITSKSLTRYFEYLQTERTITRINQFGNKVVTTRKPLSAFSLAGYLKDVRTLFNAACTEYNDYDNGNIPIAHMPFKRFAMPKIPESKKRNIKVQEIQLIRDAPDAHYETNGTNRVNLARDVFMLSFYLLGMNTADLYNCTDYRNNRITYNRMKTKKLRKDNARISVFVPTEVEAIVTRYAGRQRIFRFYEMYPTAADFNKHVNVGLKVLSTSLGLPPLTTYYARHSFATIARNVCGIPKDDIHLALNHVDSANSITDMYIEKDWSIIDRVQQQVLDTLK